MGGSEEGEDGEEEEVETELPKDAKLVKSILRSMGVKQHEPRVVHQFLDFWYRYVVEILGDAQLYSEHAGKPSIDSDDLKLAIQARTSAGLSFSQPPPREVLMELARVRNSIPLPKAISGPSIALPPEQDMLVALNYQIAALQMKNIDEVEGDDGGASHTPTTSSERNGMPPPTTSQHMDPDSSRKVTFSLSGSKRPHS